MAPHRFRQKTVDEGSPLVHQVRTIYKTIPLDDDERGSIKMADTTQNGWQRFYTSPVRSELFALFLAAWTMYTIYLWYNAAQNYQTYDHSFHWFFAASLHICALASCLMYLALSPRRSELKSHRVRCCIAIATPSVMYVYMVQQAIFQYLDTDSIRPSEEEDVDETAWAGMGTFHLVLALVCCGLGIAGVTLSEPRDDEETWEDDWYDEDTEYEETVGWRHW